MMKRTPNTRRLHWYPIRSSSRTVIGAQRMAPSPNPLVSTPEAMPRLSGKKVMRFDIVLPG